MNAADGEAGGASVRAVGVPNGDEETRRRRDHWERLRSIRNWGVLLVVSQTYPTCTACPARLPRDERFQRVAIRADAFDSHFTLRDVAGVLAARWPHLGGQLKACDTAPVGDAEDDILMPPSAPRPRGAARDGDGLPAICAIQQGGYRSFSVPLACRRPADAHRQLLRMKERERERERKKQNANERQQR